MIELNHKDKKVSQQKKNEQKKELIGMEYTKKNQPTYV